MNDFNTIFGGPQPHQHTVLHAHESARHFLKPYAHRAYKYDIQLELSFFSVDYGYFNFSFDPSLFLISSSSFSSFSVCRLHLLAVIRRLFLIYLAADMHDATYMGVFCMRMCT